MVEVIVFDFDGTLIDSHGVKYEAYFKVFPDEKPVKQAIESVLSDHYYKPRREVIRQILETPELKPVKRGTSLDECVEAYSEIVLEGTKHCPEVQGAGETLAQLSENYPLYLSSGTPEEPLKKVVSYRGWSPYFESVYGYPREKPKTLVRIATHENTPFEEILVVGDGKSDEESAETHGCQFIKTDESANLQTLPSKIKSLTQETEVRPQTND